MIYLKSCLVGIAGGIVAAILWVVVSFLVPIFGPMVVGRLLNRGGAAGASIGSGSILLAALIGFVTAACWALRRYGAI
jgi:hypothetical protein